MNGQFNLGSLNPVGYFTLVALVLGVLFGLISPVEDDQTRLVVLIQWLLQTCLPMFLLVCCHVLLSKTPSFKRLGPWTRLVVSGVIASILFAPIALFIDLFLDQETQVDFYMDLTDEWIGVAPPVLICWLAINAPWVLGYEFNKTHQIQEKSNQQTSNSRETASTTNLEQSNLKDKTFWALLKKDIGRDLVYLKAELHYLLVVTTKGKELILFNLKDAISEFEVDEGALCHRSYWVSFKHINQLSKNGRQGVLIMDSGDVIPVSRTRLKYFSDNVQVCFSKHKNSN